MTIVVDASALVAALVDKGAQGQWAEALLNDRLVGPHILPVETANILRKAARQKLISDDVATLAHGDLLALQLELFPYESVAARAWELRANVTAYDAFYVALAELLDAPLATLDGKLARAPGPKCSFWLPGAKRLKKP